MPWSSRALPGKPPEPDTVLPAVASGECSAAPRPTRGYASLDGQVRCEPRRGIGWEFSRTDPTRAQMPRWARIALVTGGLALAGAALGALAAGVGVALFARAFFPGLELGSGLWYVAGLGAGCGLVLLPGVAWLLLRAVPLGHACVSVTWGALVGGLGTAPLAFDVGLPFGALLGGAAGVVGSAMLLRAQRTPERRPVVRLPRRIGSARLWR